MKIKIIVVLSLLVLSVGCKKQAAATATTPASKDLLSLWTNANGALTVDYRLGNLTSAHFNAYYTWSSGDVCTCDTTVTGSQGSGAYTATCVLTTNATAYNCTTFNTTGTANYTNSSAALSHCHTAGSCIAYH
jgi:hypothetical protein